LLGRVAIAYSLRMSPQKNSPKRPRDANQLAKMIVDRATSDDAEPAIKPDPRPEIQKAASAMGRKGGKARAERLTAEERSGIAKRGAATRWKKGEDGQ